MGGEVSFFVLLGWHWNCADIATHHGSRWEKLHFVKLLWKFGNRCHCSSKDRESPWPDFLFPEENWEGVVQSVYSNRLLQTCLKQCVSDMCSTRKLAARDLLLELLHCGPLFCWYGVARCYSRGHSGEMVAVEEKNGLKSVLGKNELDMFINQRQNLHFLGWRTLRCSKEFWTGWR